MTANSDESIRFEWHPDDDETIAELRLDAERLKPSAVSLQLFEAKGAVLVGYILAAMALPALIREVTDVVCRIRRRGLILDARGDGPLKIKKTGTLPGGSILVIDKEGKSAMHNVCDGKIDLAALIKAASAAT